MLLGKRPRPQVMKRTSSLTEFSLDAGAPPGTLADHDMHAAADHRCNGGSPFSSAAAGGGSGYWSAMVSPRNWRRNSGDFAVETAGFLKACGLCRRRLAPGKDIYMYRGEIAFCSSECRQQQMNMDEKKEKRPPVTRVSGDLPQASAMVTEPAGSSSAASGTVAAA